MKASFLFALMVVGCGGSSAVNITKSVGAAGGTVSHSDGTTVTVPMGALTATANITISSVDATAPAGTVIVGPAYDFGPEGTVFSQPVNITLPYQTSKIPAGRTANDIVIYTAARGSTQYTALATGLGSGTVSTTTTHFTVYLPAVLAVVAGANLAGTDNFFPDMSVANCSPHCTTGPTSCSCTETCSGHTYVMTCSQSSSLATCGCEVDNVTQTSPINGVTCDDLSAVEGGFFQACAPG